MDFGPATSYLFSFAWMAQTRRPEVTAGIPLPGIDELLVLARAADVLVGPLAPLLQAASIPIPAMKA
jgi:hypothetical protein